MFPRVVCVIHLPPLPGSPLCKNEVWEISEFALKSAKAVEEGGADGIIIENYGDKPFLKEVGVETVASMAAIARDVVREVNVSVGINVLRNDCFSSIAIAKAVKADFIRVNQLYYSSLSPEGWLESRAAELMRYKAFLKCDSAVFADVSVKHAKHFVNAEEYAENFERSLADAAIVTGSATGKAVNLRELRFFKNALSKPVYAGSGITPEIAEKIKEKRLADGIIVGTYVKEMGEISVERVKKVVKAFK